MEKIKIEKENGHRIPCLLEIPENPKGIAIMIHGFTSSKSCATAELLFRRLPMQGIGVVTYDQPAHGEEEARKEPLRIENCKDSLAYVEDYVAAEYPDTEIYYFGSSYGAYITGLYISTRKHRGRKAFFRSAAVIMPRLILGEPGSEPDPEVLAELERKGYVEPDLGLGDVIRLPEGFFEDLQDNDLYDVLGDTLKSDKKEYNGVTIEMVHGEKDPVIPLSAACDFAEKFGIKIIVMEDEGHSICNRAESPEKVADLAIAFYNQP